MATEINNPPANETGSGKLRIYLLPNLLTAGNLFCGFLALTRIVEADITDANFAKVIRNAIFFIILACVFDLLDGRVARLGGYESPFGREFDSLADIISFGAAPAFLVHRVVLRDVFASHPEFGWFIASIYLICGAFRLARFNCLAMQAQGSGGNEFLGFPIPSAAGLVASITLFLLWLDEHEWLDERFVRTPWRYSLPVILVFLSVMMVSEVKYPSFKKFDWRARRTFPKMVVTIVAVGFFLIAWHQVIPVLLPLFFTAYLVYGFIRPRLSRKMVHDIEEEDDEEEPSP
ncbi:MAG TPA: CDP-diacylglycerol--serine O-phosphatidyltransferase [Candidatus Angelobacter sp.]|nr:CDP-diacylglycerol--serine O-phosphatidyltransferase [Candidatus Angelobacter sp.]